MSVDRLSKKALQKILSGKVKEDATCVVKFYSNDCPLCHNLKDKYEEIAGKYNDVYFFAFNIQDYPTAEKVLGFPEKPYENMWFNPKDIIEFIEKEK